MLDKIKKFFSKQLQAIKEEGILKILLRGLKNLRLRVQRSIGLRYIIFGLILLFIPRLVENDVLEYSSLTIYSNILVYAAVALGINLLLGFSGLISLGTAGFVGLGAYSLIYFNQTIGLPFELAILITLLLAALIGAFIGLLSLKIEGIYLAIATLFVGEIFGQMFQQFTWFTNGPSGVRLSDYPLLFGKIQLERGSTFIFLVVILIILMIILLNIIHSKTGRALMAMSRSEHAAQAMGISLLKYRLIAFIIATIYAAMGGIMYASFFRFVEPTGWTLMMSLMVIAVVVVGGFKSLFGTVLGAFIIIGIPNLYLKDFFSKINGLAYIFSGLLIILVIMFYPNGTVFIWHDIKKGFNKLINSFKKKEVE